MDYRLKPVSFADLPHWDQDDPSELIGALRRCRQHVLENKPYKTGSLGISVDDLMPVYNAAAAFSTTGTPHSRQFFETHFVPHLVVQTGGAAGFVTAFYEPEIAARAKPDRDFRYPFYRRPADLIDVDDGNRPVGMDPYFAYGRFHEGIVEEYPDRRLIDQGLFDGRNLEIAYAQSKVDVFFAHVQGAARLLFADGSTRRITFAAKTGHRFSAIGKLLIDLGEIDPLTVSMGSIRVWLASHPDRIGEILWHNQSYIFFREAAVDDPALGPVAAAKVPLVAGRSLAVDRTIHTFGVPFYISSETLHHLDADRHFARLMLSLDTGSAIVGPARGDIFTGSGPVAGDQAGSVRNAADFFVFIPKAAAARFSHG
ncbi:murein transglycosylase A [Pararhizobium sp.]|uniref:murein transglycosylase A n=1 Tax=Pararhizobium sp. TaxID=1977563 RepID=UPI0027170D97|nr:murein transglycosylase A [Pararhizobium sp.]MDO9416806.1 murein transglycosylase A [Pararhizobium sp.]